MKTLLWISINNLIELANDKLNKIAYLDASFEPKG